jgi:hypothetical protein
MMGKWSLGCCLKMSLLLVVYGGPPSLEVRPRGVYSLVMTSQPAIACAATLIGVGLLIDMARLEKTTRVQESFVHRS